MNKDWHETVAGLLPLYQSLTHQPDLRSVAQVVAPLLQQVASLPSPSAAALQPLASCCHGLLPAIGSGALLPNCLQPVADAFAIALSTIDGGLAEDDDLVVDGPPTKGKLLPRAGRMEPAKATRLVPAAATEVPPIQIVSPYFAALLSQGGADPSPLSQETVLERQSNERSGEPWDFPPEPTVVKHRPHAIEYEHEVIANALDTLHSAGRHRVERRWDEAGREETRIATVLDAARLVSGSIPAATRSWWSQMAEVDDPYKVWAVAIICRGVTGRQRNTLLEECVVACPQRGTDWVDLLVEAVDVVERVDTISLARRWSMAAPPALRAAGVRLLARLGAPISDLQRWLYDPALEVVRAALVALLDAGGATTALLPVCHAWMRVPDAAVARAAAWTLAYAGSEAPRFRILEDEGFRRLLGMEAMDLLTCFGSDEDFQALDLWTATLPLEEGIVEALGRVGTPQHGRRLLAALGDEDLHDAASVALSLMCGLPREPDLPPSEHWGRVLAGYEGLNGRLWFGAPWAPSALAETAAVGSFSRRCLCLRAREVGARCQVERWPSPHAAGRVFAEQMEEFCARARAARLSRRPPRRGDTY